MELLLTKVPDAVEYRRKAQMRLGLYKLVPAVIAICLMSGCFLAKGGAENGSTPNRILKDDGGLDFEALDRKLLQIIASHTSKPDEVDLAISHLGKKADTPRFWLALADDTSYTLAHRRKCVFAFFRRHANSVTSVASLSSKLGKPVWLHSNDIEVVSVVTGWIPVDMDLETTVFRIAVLSPKYAVYIKVLGKHLDRQAFVDLLLGGSGPQTKNEDIIIQQIGVFDEATAARLLGKGGE